MSNIKIAYSPVNGTSICNNLVNKLKYCGHNVSFIEWPTDQNPHTNWEDYTACLEDQINDRDILVGICFGGTLAISPELKETHNKLSRMILINTPIDFDKVPSLNALKYIKTSSIQKNITPRDFHITFNGSRYIFFHIKELDMSNPITYWAENSFKMMHRQLMRDLITEVKINTLKDRISYRLKEIVTNVVGIKDTLVPFESSHLLFNHIIYGPGGHLTPFLKPDTIVEIINRVK